MEADIGSLVQGGGLLAFAAAVYMMLRDHLHRLESVLGEISSSLAAVQVTLNAIATDLARPSDDRKDVTPIARPRPGSRA